MQKKIYRTILSIVITVIMILTAITTLVGYNLYMEISKQEIIDIAKIVTSGQNEVEDIKKSLDENLEYSIRLTFIKSDGSVTYDSDADVSEIGNHLEREEVAQAFSKGYGSSIRMSDTISETTYYYAVKYNGGVLRFSRGISSMYSLIIDIFPIMICVIIIVILIATVCSVKLSNGLVRPVRNLVSSINLFEENKGPVTVEYEEFQPIADNVEKLSKRLSRYINRLKREKQRFTLITDNMVEGMILLDDENTILSVNKSAVNFLNKDFEIDEHQNILELTRNPEILKIISEVGKKDSFDGVVEIDGKSLRIFVNKASNTEEYGKIVLLVDVTSTVKNEIIRREFSSNVSHELKTPLTTIKGFGEMIEKGIITNADDVKKYGGTIYRESERLLQLINDIIRLSEIEENPAFERENVNLLEIAKETAEVLQYKADSHEVEINIEGEDIIVECNSTHMNELIFNLMDNAVKYNNKGGSVWVRIQENGDNALISVKDNGIGISPENTERIFERFYRVDKSRSKQTGGTGLGLSIVKHIVLEHNGSLNMESELGKGTEIIVSLPKKKADEE